MHRWQCVSLMAALLCVLTARPEWPSKVSTDQPDKVLFERPRSAVGRNRPAIANVTLQTLVNTYPDSE